MRVPLLDLTEEYRMLGSPIRDRIDDVLASHNFILGPHVEEFERAICDYTGAAHAIGMSSGTDALLATFMSLGFGVDEAVITT
ncbi:MAG: DegT/DnrJ/EryC1/StrS family aminotransferase, partial [Verrucomicrobiaceae bacterium]|nr:DegT/DnrJ/EryC1/StrS family aminotransferase [Verrucomicrobiaceae bacterium]